MNLTALRLEGMDLIHMAEGMGRWRAVSSRIVHPRFPWGGCKCFAR
jgi:hypothetical protein